MGNIFEMVDIQKKHLTSFRPLELSEIKRLREDYIIEATYNSNAIEGSSLTLRETALILKEGVTIAQKPLKEHLEAIGFKDAFWYMVELAESQVPLTESLIKQIHSLVLTNDPHNKGKYRSIPVAILGAHATPPEPHLVPQYMEQLLVDYENWKRSMHHIEAVAKFHLEFESIHPFIDGNGRTGRLIMNYELIKEGYLPIDIKFADRDRYYDAFDAYHKGSCSHAVMSQLVAEYEYDELTRYIPIVEKSARIKEQRRELER